LQETPRTVDSGLCATPHRDAQLPWRQEELSPSTDSGIGGAGDQAAEGEANGDGAQAAVLLAEGHEASAEQNRAHRLGNLAAEAHVGEGEQGGQQSLAGWSGALAD
jgi:hypothetical protein